MLVTDVLELPLIGRVGLEGAVAIHRKDFGVTWNAALEGGGVLSSGKVVVGIEVSAVRTA
ncbi:YceI family protein [Kribbella sp. HUAS MG21]|uniref:YceI family protein n=1 Tax=Kribbella sp. HUAS MG21 TaxID=3160966 RepID=A0AAU7TEH9_9ACTN